MLTTTVSNFEQSGSSMVQLNMTTTNVTCVSRKKTSFLLFSIIPSLSILINMVVLLAISLNSQRLLRQSRVYAHVSSTVIANVTFSLFALVQILSLYFNFEGHNGDPREGYQGAVKSELKQWWAFRKAFLYGLYIIMCGNIGLLIGAIRSTTCAALRSAAGAVNIHSKKPRKWEKGISFGNSSRRSIKSRDTSVPSSRVARRRQSYISIAALWIVPLCYALTPSFGWSCVNSCTCLSSCFPQEQLWDPSVRKCSRAFPPMANSWLGLTIGIWAACVLGVIIMLRRSILILRRTREQHRPVENKPENADGLNVSPRFEPESVEILRDRAFSQSQNNGAGGHSLNDDQSSSQQSTFDHPGDTAQPDTRKKNNRVSGFSSIFSSDGRSLLRRKSQASRGLFHRLEMGSNLKYVIWLTVSFAICTAPPMIYLLADMIFVDLKLNMIVLNTCLLFPFIYCFTCPFLLAKCLPGIKSSLVHMIFRMCTYTTTVKRGDSA